MIRIPMKRLALTMLIAMLAVPCSRCSFAREAEIAFTGDIIMHIPVKSCARARNRADGDRNGSLNNGGFDFLFERIRDDLRHSDVVVGNMEFPVSPPFRSEPWIFNCLPESIGAMKWAGVTMVTIANNHMLDQGGQGVVDTMRFLSRQGMEYIGAGETGESARAGIVKKVRGVRVGFLGYTGVLNYPLAKKRKGYHLNQLDNRQALVRDIEEMRKRCDYLVLVAHAGEEYMPRPRKAEQDLFRDCVNAGADLVIGHHPHLVQRAERVTSADGRVCHIFYSLGNFISNQGMKAEAFYDGAPLTTRDSVIVRCLLKRAGRGKRPLARFEVLPVYTVNTIERETGARAIQTVSIPREAAALKLKRDGATAQERVDIGRQLQNLYIKSKALRMAIFGSETGRAMEEVKFIDDSGTYE